MSNFIVNPYRFEVGVIATNLVNGSNYTVDNTATPATAECNTGGSDGSYAYDSIATNAGSSVVKYYYTANGGSEELIHTSSLATSADLYAKAHAYWTGTKAGMEKITNGYKWTVLGDPDDWVQASGAGVIGLEDTTTGSGRNTNQYSFKFQDNAGDKLYVIEEGVEVMDPIDSLFPLSLGDIFVIKW